MLYNEALIREASGHVRVLHTLELHVRSEAPPLELLSVMGRYRGSFGDSRQWIEQR